MARLPTATSSLTAGCFSTVTCSSLTGTLISSPGRDVRRGGGLTRRGLPLDDDLIPLDRDFHRLVLRHRLLAASDLARFHRLLVSQKFLLADSDPRAPSAVRETGAAVAVPVANCRSASSQFSCSVPGG